VLDPDDQLLDPVILNGDWMGEFMVMQCRVSYQWIGLKEHLQETMGFTIKYRGFL
jgi:hypothetical protein